MSHISCMSFNILACDTHDSGYELPANRLSYVLETIKQNNADLVGLQEVCDQACAPSEKRDARCGDFNWCETMLSAASSMGYTAVAIRDQQGFLREKQNIGCGLMIYYKTDRFEMLENGCEVFPHNDVRYFQWVKLHDKQYDRTLLFTNTHFSINPKIGDTKSQMAGDAYRTTQSALLMKFWYKQGAENLALFATGDYNSTPESNAQTLLRSHKFKPSYLIAETSDERGTMNFRKTAHTIDFCYVNPTAQAVKQYKVITTHFYSERSRYALAGYPSDHRAIMTYCNYL